MRDLLKRAGILLAAALLTVLVSCGKNGVTTLLTPSGERPVPANSSVSGKLEFGTGTYARSLVLIAPVKSGATASGYSSIGISGTLVAAGFVPTSAPLLTQLAPRCWVDTLTILAGSALHWKFTTDLDFDTNPDYGHPSDRTGLDGLKNTAANPAGGPQGDLQADVAAGVAGTVVCALIEDATGTTATYAFLPIGAGSPASYTSTSDGSFSIAGLTAGRYNLLIRTPGALRDTLISNLLVSGPTGLGTINLSGSAPVGAVTGSVDYAGPNGFADLASPPYPPTTVRLVQSGTTIATVNTGRGSNAFNFTNVVPGTYDVVADAPVFSPLTRSAVTVAAGPATDTGVFQLIKTNTEVSNSITIASDFNSYDQTDPAWDMSQSALGVWTWPDPINQPTPDTISAGVHTLKFVTDYAFDNPPDYGGDETVTIDVPVTDAITFKVTGTGTAIKLNFPTRNVYKFSLDERRQVFSITPYPAPPATRTARR